MPRWHCAVFCCVLLTGIARQRSTSGADLAGKAEDRLVHSEAEGEELNAWKRASVCRVVGGVYR